MLPVYVTKTLTTASTNGVGLVSSANPPVITVNTSQLDTQRRITIFATSDSLVTATFTVVGTREGGGSLRETLTGPTSLGGTTPMVTTKQDFLSVTAISVSSVISGNAVFGTSSMGGTPWKSANTHITPVQIGGVVSFTSSANSVKASLEYTYDDVTLTSAGTVPGGQVASLNNPPIAVTSTAFSSVDGLTAGVLNIAGAAQVPIWGWRLTIASSATAAATVTATVIQAGIG